MELHPGEVAVKEYYICGPGNMIEGVSDILINRGVEKKSVHKEYFSSPDDKNSINVSAPDNNGTKNLKVLLVMV